MPKSKHRKKKPLPPPLKTRLPPDPDFGEYLWKSGYAGKPLVLVSALPRRYHDYGPSTDLSFVIHTADGKFMGTLNTPQPAAMLGMFIDGRTPVRIDAQLDTKLVRGNGGERYRLLLGTINPLDPAEAASVEPTIGHVPEDQLALGEKMAGECRNTITHEPIQPVTGFNPPIDPTVIEFLSFYHEPIN
jgi:hypothetical protein